MTLLWSRDRAYLPDLWDRLSRIRPAIEEIFGLTIAACSATMAMSALFAVLGAAISFAVFLTSYMQVERMDEQNKLIERQIKQTDEQMKFAARAQDVAVALSVGDRRQVMLRELITRHQRRPRHLRRRRPAVAARREEALPARVTARHLRLRRPARSPTSRRHQRPTTRRTTSPRPPQPRAEQLLRYLAAANVDFGRPRPLAAFLDHADLHATVLERIRSPRRMRSAKLYDANLTGADLAGADLTLAVASPAPSSAQANLADRRPPQGQPHRRRPQPRPTSPTPTSPAPTSRGRASADPARPRRAPRRQPRRRATSPAPT
jgi:hypothetical protein